MSSLLGSLTQALYRLIIVPYFNKLIKKPLNRFYYRITYFYQLEKQNL